MSEQNEYEVKLPSGMTVKVRNLMADYEALVAENKRLRETLLRIRDYDWTKVGFEHTYGWIMETIADALHTLNHPDEGEGTG